MPARHQASVLGPSEDGLQLAVVGSLFSSFLGTRLGRAGLGDRRALHPTHGHFQGTARQLQQPGTQDVGQPPDPTQPGRGVGIFCHAVQVPDLGELPQRAGHLESLHRRIHHVGMQGLLDRPQIAGAQRQSQTGFGQRWQVPGIPLRRRHLLQVPHQRLRQGGHVQIRRQFIQPLSPRPTQQGQQVDPVPGVA